MAGRSFAAVILALVAFVTASVEKATSASGRVECGVERWTVKTLQDRPTLLPAQQTTIAFLTSRPAPASLLETRLPFERHIFTVIARVVLIRHESNDDFHVVLGDGRRTIGALAPARQGAATLLPAFVSSTSPPLLARAPRPRSRSRCRPRRAARSASTTRAAPRRRPASTRSGARASPGHGQSGRTRRRAAGRFSSPAATPVRCGHPSS